MSLDRNSCYHSQIFKALTDGPEISRPSVAAELTPGDGLTDPQFRSTFIQDGLPNWFAWKDMLAKEHGLSFKVDYLSLGQWSDAGIRYSFNNVTAKKDKDGSITIRFGGDPKADNFLPIVPGWNYIVRLYKPGPEILNGTWTFPDPEPAQ